MVVELFYILTVVVVMKWYIFVNIHRKVCFRLGKFIEYKL